jgi:hypothetical protein
MELRKEKVQKKKKQKQTRITEDNKKQADRKYAGQQEVNKVLLPLGISMLVTLRRPELNTNLNC